jgi:hypothetical protein
MPSSIYLKHEITIKDLPQRFTADARASMAQKWWFVGLDLAPSDSLESGIAVLDRKRCLMRMEKLSHDADLLAFLDNLAGSANVMVVLDIPKTLSLTSKWRQQEVRMHPLTLQPTADGGVPSECYANRAKAFYKALEDRGILTFGFFTAHARLRYGLNIPYRHRSSAGCRAMQGSLKQRLGIRDFPSNLAASAILDATLAAYTGWLICHGKEAEHFKLYHDQEQRLYVDPLQCLMPPKVSRRNREYLQGFRSFES